MDSAARPEMDYEAETLLARISHRLERLYNIIAEGPEHVAKEKADLQSLLSDISHQTKTPIANLKMLNETMLTRPISEEQRREFLQATGSQLDKLDFLIQAMVKTSRLEAGVITLEKKDASIEETLVNAINGILAPMEKKGIELTVNCPEGLAISHDSRWTSEALFNLLDNAVKYTPVGGSIHVSIQNWEMYWKIDVTDTGRGIPEQETGQDLQNWFYREEAVHEVDGIGIGLYLAREIMQPCRAGTFWWTSGSWKRGYTIFGVPSTRIIQRRPVRAAAFFKKIIPAWILGHFCNNSVLDCIHIEI